MREQDAGTASEVERLRSRINDLVSVLALPAIWTGQEASVVATALLEVMVRMLGADFGYVCVSDGALRQWARLDAVPSTVQPDELGKKLAPHLAGDFLSRFLSIPNPLGDGLISLACSRLGLQAGQDVLVVGSRRPGFPSVHERLLLQVATNQAAIGIQEARYANGMQRATDELKRHVEERTSELASVNEALQAEVRERVDAQRRIHQSERELRLLVDFVPEFIAALEPDGAVRHVNLAGLTYLGCSLDELVRLQDGWARFHHPEDAAVVHHRVERALAESVACELEVRMRRHDGAYRWFMMRYEPLRDEYGRVIRWYSTGVDVDDRKREEERMRAENLALREEVDKASMFEEIVGTSAVLHSVLSQVFQVAPTDATVLITGETGTGKELVARAIHRKSARAARALVSVNCAAIPASLLASELFGHEKGAFTGAVQSRQGRFELANGGTIFLDEVGELPAEMQTALLRVLQEREFERVGGSRPIRTDVRVIAATNCDLEKAVAEKKFRADLFYRLNVFPVEMPSLRERKSDIPLLVEYFAHRYASRMGKRVTRIEKMTLKLLQAYGWPGNVRELQNVIERAVIVSGSETLWVDERWLSGRALATSSKVRAPQLTLEAGEREAIENALIESRGRVSGPFGAAARLGIPASTLESKIKALRIDKGSFKAEPSAPAR